MATEKPQAQEMSFGQAFNVDAQIPTRFDPSDLVNKQLLLVNYDLNVNSFDQEEVIAIYQVFPSGDRVEVVWSHKSKSFAQFIQHAEAQGPLPMKTKIVRDGKFFKHA